MTARKTAPVAAEAADAPSILTFRGIKFEIAPTASWSLDALEAFEDGKVTTFLRSILGPAQWAALKGAAPQVGDLTDFVEALQGALGIAGN
jgi:hypothetical protein